MSKRLIGILMCMYAISSAQDSLNVTLLGNYQGHKELNPQNLYYSAVWGYTDVDGREYALLGCYSGTAIVDLTYLPDSLHEVAFVPGPQANYSYREFKTYLHYLYIVSEGGSGVQVLDLSPLPDSVRFIGNFSYSGFTRAHSISETHGTLYLNGGNGTLGDGDNQGGSALISLVNPEFPVKVGSFATWYVHDSYERNDTLFAAHVYGSPTSGIGFSIIDVRDKSQPVFLKNIQYPNAGTHNAWTTDDGGFLFTTDEINGTPKTLKVWDIRDLETITKVGEWNPRPSDIVHNVTVKGSLAYIAWYTAGLLIADVSDPTTPDMAGFYDTYPQTSGGYKGAWGVYPYFPSGRIAVSDMNTGLYVFSFSGQSIGKVVGRITDASSGAPLVGATLKVRETGHTRWTNADGRYLWGYATGSFHAIVESPGFTPAQVVLTIPEGSTDTLDIELHAAVTEVEGSGIARSFNLGQNFPNPFNPATNIPFMLPSGGIVRIEVFNILGQAVGWVEPGWLPGGEHAVPFHARDLPSGVYIYRLTSGTYRASGRMILAR